MSLPVMTSKEDVDAIVEFLKGKPVGITRKGAEAIIGARLIETRKITAYRRWGFVTEADGKLMLTDLGHNYYEASEEEKQRILSEVIRGEEIYRVTLEWINQNKWQQVTQADVAAHWFKNFKAEVGSAERAIREQVSCFLNIAAAAGVGNYIIGRKKQPTRLEVNRTALTSFIEGTPETAEASDTENVDDIADQVNGNREYEPTATVPEPVLPRRLTDTHTSPLSLHIDIQIHIDPDASPDQIEQIFASMAKHLYKNE